MDAALPNQRVRVAAHTESVEREIANVVTGERHVALLVERKQ